MLQNLQKLYRKKASYSIVRQTVTVHFATVSAYFGNLVTLQVKLYAEKYSYWEIGMQPNTINSFGFAFVIVLFHTTFGQDDKGKLCFYDDYRFRRTQSWIYVCIRLISTFFLSKEVRR